MTMCINLYNIDSRKQFQALFYCSWHLFSGRQKTVLVVIPTTVRIVIVFMNIVYGSLSEGKSRVVIKAGLLRLFRLTQGHIPMDKYILRKLDNYIWMLY